MPASIRLLEAINIFQKESRKLNIHRELEGLFVQLFIKHSLLRMSSTLSRVMQIKFASNTKMLVYAASNHLQTLKKHPCTTSPCASNKISVANII